MAESTTTLPGAKEDTVTSVPPIDTIAVPPVETTTAPPVETTTAPPVETTTVPPEESLEETIARIQKETPDIVLEMDIPREETLEEKISKIKDEARQFYREDVRRGFDSIFLKAFDFPGNAFINTLDYLIGRDTSGPFPTGVEFDKEYYKHGFTKLATELGILAKPEDRPAVFGVPEGKFPPQSDEFRIGEFAGETAIFYLLSPLMSKIPYPKMQGPEGGGFSLREADLTKWQKVRRFLSGIGEMAIEHPKKTLGIEMLASYGGAHGQLFAQKAYPGSLAAEFLFTAAAASGITLLPMRTMWSGMKHYKDVGVQRFGGEGALQKAKERVQAAANDPEKALENLNNLEQFHKDVLSHLSTAEITMDKGMLMIQKAFLKEATEHTELHHIDRWKQIHDILVEVASTPAADVKITKDAIEDSIKMVKALIDDRLEIAKTRIANEIMEKRRIGKLSAKEANLIAREIVDREYEIARQTDKELWEQVDKDIKISTVPIRSALKDLLEQTKAEAGDLMKLTSEGAALGDPNAIARFIGTMKETTVFDVVLGTRRKVRTFVPGTWGLETDLGAIQAIRHRLLLEGREIRSKPAANKYKLALLAKLDEAFLQAVGAIERKGFHGPLTAEAAAYERALAFTRQFKKQYGQPHIKKLMEVDKQGNPKVIEELTLDKIFSGKGPRGAAAGAATINEFLTAIRKVEVQGRKGDPAAQQAVNEMRGAIEDVIKARFTYEAVEGGVIDTRKAKAFIKAHDHLWENEVFPQIKRDLEEAIQWNDLTILKENKFNNLKKHITDPRTSLATIYIKESPNKAFDDLISSKYPTTTEIQKELKRFIYDLNKEPTGIARDGFEGSFMQWMANKAIKTKQTDLQGEYISGQLLKTLWDDPKVQFIAKSILKKERYKTMEQMVRSAEALDLARLTHKARGGVFDTMPNVMFERLLRYAALKYSPMPDTGRGSISADRLLSESIKDRIRKHFRDPAIDILTKAFMDGDIELMKLLFTDIISMKNKPFKAKQINAWLATALHNMGQTAINEDEE